MAPREPTLHNGRQRPVAAVIALLAAAVAASIVVAAGGLIVDDASPQSSSAEQPPPLKQVAISSVGTSSNDRIASVATPATAAPLALPAAPPQRLKRVAVERATGTAALVPALQPTPTTTAKPTQLSLVPDYSRAYKAAIVGRWFGGRHHWTFEQPYTCPSGCTMVFSTGSVENADALLYHLAPTDMETSRSMLQRASQRANQPGTAPPQLQVAFAAEFFPPMADPQLLSAFNAEVSFRGRSLARDIQYPLEAVSRFNRSALAAAGPFATDADVDRLTWNAVAPPMVPLSERISLSNGSISWASNHCNSASGRESFIRELLRHVPVDAYRAPCLKNVPPEKADATWQQQWESWRRYKFYLAFENSVTDDPTGNGNDGYVTEKFYLALVRGQVPVVLGSHHVADHAPPGSFINALDYASPAALAEHLWQLDTDDSQFARYFEWRDQPFGSYGTYFLEALRVSVPIAEREGPDQGGRMFACNLCAALARWHAAGRPTNSTVLAFKREAAVEVLVVPPPQEKRESRTTGNNAAPRRVGITARRLSD